MADTSKTKSYEAQRAEVEAIFDAEVPTFFMNAEGDWFRGVVQDVAQVTTEHGISPSIEFALINGSSAATIDVAPGTVYRVAMFGKLMTDAFAKYDPQPGDTIAMMNKGKVANQKGDRTYTDMRFKVLQRASATA